MREFGPKQGSQLGYWFERRRKSVFETESEEKPDIQPETQRQPAAKTMSSTNPAPSFKPFGLEVAFGFSGSSVELSLHIGGDWPVLFA